MKFDLYLKNAFDRNYTVKFLLRLIALYLIFRCLNMVSVALISPDGYYSAFVDQYLNYVTVVKVTIVKTGAWLANVFGTPSLQIGDSILQVNNGGQLRMDWPCCGLEIMSFWAAFTIADTTPTRTKILWCTSGLFAIWFINCLRVAFLGVAKQYHWGTLLQLDQHALFNFAGYSLVMVLIFLYYKQNRKHFSVL